MSPFDVYGAMLYAICNHDERRTVTDPTSPRQSVTVEAEFAAQFTVSDVCGSLPDCDRRWAIANLLHFFAGTEEAGILRKYNEHASKFLVGDRWPGAYGATCVPQVRACIDLLRRHPDTRRAIVTMGSVLDPHTVNTPQCWNLLHFQATDGVLSAAVYQRSLSLRVMPYDAVVLTNVLRYVAALAGLSVGSLVWIIGNLHRDESDAGTRLYMEPILPPIDLLSRERRCWEYLHEEELWTGL